MFSAVPYDSYNPGLTVLVVRIGILKDTSGITLPSPHPTLPT